MTFEDLQLAWERHDRKLEAALRLNARLLRGGALGRAEVAIRRFSALVVAGLVLNAALILWLGSFLADHVAEPRFLLPAAVLHVSAILLLGSSVRRLVAARQIDYGAPLVEIQRRLGELRASEARATMGTLLLSPALFAPLLVVSLEGLLGVDAYAVLPGAWLAGNFAFGLLVALLAAVLARRYGLAWERSPGAQWIARHLSGYNLAAATEFLDSVARFEAEESEGPDGSRPRA